MIDADGRPTGSPVKFTAAPFYPIVDLTADRMAVADLARAVLRAGAPWLQLRCKGAPASSFLEIACEIVAAARSSGAGVIVNDRLDIALASGAAGVHLGQDDLPLAVARRLAGNRLVIGVSTHDVGEARAAEDGGADYVGFGPMFTTASKADARTPRTLDALRSVRDAIRIPIVAIGGIDPDSAPAILDAGADAVAMIGALASAPDPTRFTAQLLAFGARAR